MKPGLSRIKKFLNKFGNPQESLKFIHIAGTNGKGSTACFTENILRKSGYKTGLYTSPHLTDITERIKINGKNISKSRFKRLSETYLAEAKKCRLSYFEYLTALSFIYFAEQKADIVVLETGLGGRFDATNIIKKPLLCIITSIGFDHKEFLGNTVEKIAFEKAGIIKKGADVVCGKLPLTALNVIKAKAEPFVFGKHFKAVNIKYDKKKEEESFDYCGISENIKGIKLSLPGDCQIRNASVGICVAELLAKKGFLFKRESLKKALYESFLPARFDVREVKFAAKKIKLIIDGSHNPQAFDAFIASLKRFYGGKYDFIFAAMKEKEYKKIIKKIIPYADNIILPDFKNARAVKNYELEKEFLKYKPAEKIFTVPTVGQALRKLKNSKVSVVSGSFYLAGAVLKNI